MNKSNAVVLLLSGVVATIIGISCTNSFFSDLSRFFNRSGSSTDNAIWMFLGGTIAAIAGLVLTWRHRKEA
jgi:hypothetical protein